MAKELPLYPILKSHPQVNTKDRDKVINKVIHICTDVPTYLVFETLSTQDIDLTKKAIHLMCTSLFNCG